MKAKIGLQAFVWYAVVGFILAGLAGAGVVEWIGPKFFPDPQYRAYVQERAAYDRWQAARESWRAQHQDQLNQHQFEGAVAGTVSIESIEDESLRDFVRYARALTPRPEVTTLERATAARRLFMAGSVRNRQPAWMNWVNCEVNGDECSYTGPLKSMNNPEHFARLLAGDVTAVVAAPDRPVQLDQARHAPHVVEPRLFPPVRGFWAVLVGAIWLFFAIGYYTAGARMYRGYDDARYPNPVTARPNFIMGWVILILMLPGLLVMRFFISLFAEPKPPQAFGETSAAAR